MKQIWFHGFIPKKEAEQFLKRNGDFLVWEMMNNTEQDRFVISSYHNGALHFKVTAEYIVVSQIFFFIQQTNFFMQGRIRLDELEKQNNRSGL